FFKSRCSSPPRRTPGLVGRVTNRRSVRTIGLDWFPVPTDRWLRRGRLVRHLGGLRSGLLQRLHERQSRIAGGVVVDQPPVARQVARCTRAIRGRGLLSRRDVVQPDPALPRRGKMRRWYGRLRILLLRPNLRLQRGACDGHTGEYEHEQTAWH